PVVGGYTVRTAPQKCGAILSRLFVRAGAVRCGEDSCSHLHLKTWIPFHRNNAGRPLNDPVDIVYFYYSFGYLLLRSVSVSLFAASIYDETKEPKAILYSVPSESFNVEVQRFLQQVTFDDVVLTGLNFFSITRSLLLTVWS
ncbi:unnamed protein product, partial [Timema podura]|nr:unnamed protein product [Timema podura]